MIDYGQDEWAKVVQDGWLRDLNMSQFTNTKNYLFHSVGHCDGNLAIISKLPLVNVILISGIKLSITICHSTALVVRHVVIKASITIIITAITIVIIISTIIILSHHHTNIRWKNVNESRHTYHQKEDE